MVERGRTLCYASGMAIQRVHVKEAVKHPWRGDMTKVVDSEADTLSQAYGGWMGEVVFTETPHGILMEGYRRRAAHPDSKLEARLSVHVPWDNIKWDERGAAPARAERSAKRERPLGAAT